MLVKLYGAPPDGQGGTAERKYSPGECVGIREATISGKPASAPAPALPGLHRSTRHRPTLHYAPSPNPAPALARRLEAEPPR